jgi:prealbumin domain-containing protein
LTLGIAPKRAKPRWLIALTVVTVLTLISSAVALAGAVGTAQGFEDDDGNLVNDAAAGIDWNSFDPTTWSPHPATTPTRVTDDQTTSGFKFKGLEDWQATTSDSGFAGGTKQDDNCPSVITAKADNKADLKRIYVASKTVSGETYLDLAWVRIPQNTTSPSAHIAFEFNQGTTACGSGGLVQRTTGDMLVVYDFEGGSTDTPHITLRRWVASGACEISNDSAPCWGPARDLTALGFAEAKVNTGASVLDALAPPALNSTTGTSVDATLGINEFGEAGLDLGPNGADIFGSGTCVSFGKVFGVSRTSGNSGTAQMKDLVGPGDFRLSNCGTVTIIKHTSPADLNQNFTYTSNLAGDCTTDTSPASFTLNDNGAGDTTSNTETCTNVPIGNYTVTEGADPAGFSFGSLSCTHTGTGTGAQDATVPKQANIGIVAGGDSVTCTYVNNQQLGAIKITKTRKHAADGTGDHPHAGVSFTVNGVTKQTDANGVACFDGLNFGGYTVHETVPTGYHVDGNDKSVTVDNNATCADTTYVGETVSFHNTPLTDITVSVNSQVDGGTSSTVECGFVAANPDMTTAANGDGSITKTNLEPGTYTCTIVVDP